MIMNSTGSIILAIVWSPGSLFWFICAGNPVVGILWLCGGIVEPIIGSMRPSKERRSCQNGTD